MVGLAQLVRASDCGSEGHRFETDIPPQRQPFRLPFFIPNSQTLRVSSKSAAVNHTSCASTPRGSAEYK